MSPHRHAAAWQNAAESRAPPRRDTNAGFGRTRTARTHAFISLSLSLCPQAAEEAAKYELWESEDMGAAKVATMRDRFRQLSRVDPRVPRVLCVEIPLNFGACVDSRVRGGSNAFFFCAVRESTHVHKVRIARRLERTLWRDPLRSRFVAAFLGRKRDGRK